MGLFFCLKIAIIEKIKLMKHLPCLFFIVFLLYACGADQNKKSLTQIEDLQGKWNIIKAERNGKKTMLLQDGFLSFKENSIISNINERGDTLTNNYTIDNNLIKSDDFEYNVLYNNNDTMKVSMNIKNFSFKLILKKE